MKSVLLGIVLSVGYLLANPVYATEPGEGYVPTAVDTYDEAYLSTTPNQYGNYTIILENLLTPEEHTYRNNIITFMVDDEPHMFEFYIKLHLSNEGITQKAIVFIPKLLLIQISQSKETAVKIGGNKSAVLDPGFKEQVRDMLYTTTS